MDSQYDVIVVGSGIAGLYAALLASEHGRVLLVTKGQLEESNTRYAQGGIAVAMREGDSPELHLRDTTAAGDGLCDPEAVAVLTRDAPHCIRDLLDRGVAFDRDGGELAWTLEAAHSLPRVLHAGGDATGAGIERVLAESLRSVGVRIVEHALVTDLIVRDGTVQGVLFLNEDGEALSAGASYVVLATGGAGQLYARTTNPSVATGDGLALAYRAGAYLADLEFMQFHPTALVLKGAPSFLISEAVRGEGGILRDANGRAFMGDYHPDRELAPRDVVARAVHGEMQRTGSGHVGLDITHLDPHTIESRFPSIMRFCREHGIEPLHEPIPVAPAAHYLMGGVATDTHARTSLPGLLACGEVACTGVHGANRLASNSLLEGLVFARRAVGIILDGDTRQWSLSPETEPLGARMPEAETVFDPAYLSALRETMWRQASVVRTGHSLEMAHAWVERRREPGTARSIDEHEAANLALLATLTLQSAAIREESRGGHFRSDFPAKATRWQSRIVVSRDGVVRVPLTAGAEIHAS
jgi:L-aspartate oxidase